MKQESNVVAAFIDEAARIMAELLIEQINENKDNKMKGQHEKQRGNQQ